MIENGSVNAPLSNTSGNGNDNHEEEAKMSTQQSIARQHDENDTEKISSHLKNSNETSTVTTAASSAVTASTKPSNKKEGLPDMYWLNMPEQWSVKTDEDGEKHLKVTCPDQVDFWQHTLHGFCKDDAPFYWKFVYGDFEARLTIKGKFHYLYDMAGLMVRQHEEQWMTCGIANFQDNLQSRYHKHGSKHLYVSSTFTRNAKSDWSTHRAMQKKQHKSSTFHVWVRRIGNLMECYYSLDNDLWIKVREAVFAPGVRKLRVGMMCTAPESAGFSVIFSDFMIRGGDKMPEDCTENLVYKTSGTDFVGMLEKREVERRTQESKKRMYKRVEQEKKEAKKRKSQPLQSRAQPATRTFEARNTEEEKTAVHHWRGEEHENEGPMKPRFVQLAPRGNKKASSSKSSTIKSGPPGKEWKPRPTNPYAVATPPAPKSKSPPPKPAPPLNPDAMPGVPDEEPAPPPKAPMKNPYAVAPPRPPPSEQPPHPLEKKMANRDRQARPPQRQRTNSDQRQRSSTESPRRQKSSANSPRRQNSNAKGPRNEFTGASLKVAQVDDTPQRRGFPPMRRKSDMGPFRARKPPPGRGRGHGPSRHRSDMGPRGRRPPPPPPRPPRDADGKQPKRKKSWWNLGLKMPKRKSKTGDEEEEKNFPGKGQKLGKGSRWKKSNPERSTLQKPQRKPSGDDEKSQSQSNSQSPKTTTSKSTANSVRGRKAQHHDDAPPTRPRRMPSVDDDHGLVPSDCEDDHEMEAAAASPPNKPQRVPSMEDDTILLPTDDEAEEISPKGKKEKLKKSKSSKKEKKKKKGGSKSSADDTATDDGIDTGDESLPIEKKKKTKKKKRKKELEEVEAQ